ncbi:MAG: type II toxin-antitoxin system VapC family toxin [Proteobacteria bacterium]|nr:type II toxin-antitoxin system VapC family toxin [Pseudomonadota bacterium]
MTAERRHDGPWVVDASVIVAWFFTDEPERQAALRVREAICEQPERWVIPPLLLTEAVHVLARKSARDERFVAQAVGVLLRLGLRTIALSEPALARAVHWSCRGLSGYDATYLALAEDLGGCWVTSDARAARRVRSSHLITLRHWARLHRG